MTEIEAFILIGGRSSRLGIDKAFVKLGDRTLAERAAATVRYALSPQRLVMVAGSSLQFAIDAVVHDIPFIFDLHEGRGPLGGVHAALAYAQTPWVFTMACDYPFISPELIGLLYEKIDENFGVVVPEQNDGRLQPLCAFYNVEMARPVFQEIIERPRTSPPMHEIIGQLKPRIVRFHEYSHLDGVERVFLNINTKDDLDRARSEFTARGRSC